MSPTKPCIPIPPPLMMSEEGSFAHQTLTQRWVTIIQRAIASNNYPASITQNLENLRQELPYGKVRSLEDETQPDLEAWNTYMEPYQGKRWIDIPWYPAEVYLYRRILEATHYFQPGKWHRVDPFEPQKHSSLAKVMSAIETMSGKINTFVDAQGQWNRTDLIALFYFALWGNRIDLSLFPTDAGESQRMNIEAYREQANLLVDHTPQIADHIAHLKEVRIDLIVDNAGFELFCDLCVADFFVNSGIAQPVYLHLKPHPVFVSDAMIKDVDHTINVLCNHSNQEVQSLGERLKNYIDKGHIICCEDAYWTAPLAFWDMPESWRSELNQSQLVMIKGDANYRRLLGDREWDYTTPWEDIVCYFPAPLAALRTFKAELAAGLKPDQIKRLNQDDPQWLINGQWGVIQFFNPRQ
ncbi:MAG: damage-control phosphatase ARMT1 family protein [Coleofasciculus sp.]